MRCLLVAISLVLTVPASAESWLCIADAAAGLRPSGDSWKPMSFNAGQKYVVRKPRVEEIRQNESIEYVVARFGDENAYVRCNGFNEAGITRCLGVFEFRFSREKLRFFVSHDLGWIAPLAGGPANDVWISAGTCSPI